MTIHTHVNQCSYLEKNRIAKEIIEKRLSFVYGWDKFYTRELMKSVTNIKFISKFVYLRDKTRKINMWYLVCVITHHYEYYTAFLDVKSTLQIS